MRQIAGIVLFVLAASTGQAAQKFSDIEYRQIDGESIKLDAMVPDGTGPFPVAILVHGGGWSSGDKSGSNRPGDSADITPWFAPLTGAGFVWFSINYRLAPRHPWPAGFSDVQEAIRWVKAHASEYKGDPRRIALFGHSAGGHLACLAGVLAGPDTRVQAVVGFAAVTDLEADTVHRGGQLSTSLQNLLTLPKAATPDSLARLRELSPINHVAPGLPPFLLVHGDADKSVPYAQSPAFQKKLREAGDICDLITIPGAPHRLIGWETFLPHYPDLVIAWLRRELPAGPR
jgi:alpha-L-fucosidase 2